MYIYICAGTCANILLVSHLQQSQHSVQDGRLYCTACTKEKMKNTPAKATDEGRIQLLSVGGTPLALMRSASCAILSAAGAAEVVRRPAPMASTLRSRVAATSRLESVAAEGGRQGRTVLGATCCLGAEATAVACSGGAEQARLAFGLSMESRRTSVDVVPQSSVTVRTWLLAACVTTPSKQAA